MVSCPLLSFSSWLPTLSDKQRVPQLHRTHYSSLLATAHWMNNTAPAHPASSMSHAPVGHCLGLSMVTASTGYQRPRPRSWISNCPLLLLTAITCAIPQLTRVHG